MFHTISVSSLLTGTSILTLWLPFNFYPPGPETFIVSAATYGLVSGAFVSLLMPCAAKAGSLDTLGQRFGTFQVVMAVRYVKPISPYEHIRAVRSLTSSRAAVLPDCQSLELLSRRSTEQTSRARSSFLAWRA